MTTSIKNSKYIHGYTQDEQDRLIKQSNFLEPYIFTGIDFSNCHHIIELGCGVGAQIQLLLNRWPHLKITGVDISQSQISRANEFLKPHIETGQVSLYVSDGREIPFPDESFDGAFMCFVLEHSHSPLDLLKEIKRVMKSGSSLYCHEVFNAGQYVYPTCLVFQAYWEIFNRYQRELSGDPDIGMKLSNLVLKVGFSEVNPNPIPIYLDKTVTDISHRINLIDWFIENILSIAPTWIAEDRVSLYLIEAMKQELSSIKYNEDAVFIYPHHRIKAVK
jgi:ubiquinone/menaquinone biosynthesis C-methylase UbiE